MMKFVFILSFFTIVFCGFAQNSKPNFNADSLISLMSVEEKIGFISGYKNFNLKGLERLGIPEIKMADGPMGLNGHGKATAFPASICMAATWNPELIEEMSGAIAVEAKSKGVGVLLAPGTNMYRTPHCGRNFEYYGEDPFLASQMTVSFVHGVQDKKVMATVKHLVANNQDYDRHRVSSNIDLRTLNEIYFPPFRAAVEEANVGAIMTSYNLLNGVHTSESAWLIKDVVKNEWNFDGIVMSDWISVYSIEAFEAGLDLEMPRPQFMNMENILPLIESDSTFEDILDDKVRRILNSCFRIGLYDKSEKNDSVDWQKHKNISKEVARQGFVLLKNNENLLPLNNAKNKRILVLGPNAIYTPYSGGGAAKIDAYEMKSFFQGIKDNSDANQQVDYMSVEGIFHLNSTVNYLKFKKELEKAKDYDAVVLCLGFDSKTEGEGFDRPFELPKKQQILVEELKNIQENLVVVVNSGGGVKMPWIDDVSALLFAWYPGQDGATALGEIVFGIQNPSGKLPITIEKQWSDNGAFKNYDSTKAIEGAKPLYSIYGKKHKIENIDYQEAIFTGYRHFDKNEIEPLFPFGFGLSYTNFELKNIVAKSKKFSGNDTLTVTINIKNIGNYDGFETVQLYISDIESSLPRPNKELKAFKKVFLKAGEQKSINFNITKKMLQFYNPESNLWISEKGEFDILIGNSSRNISQKIRVEYFD